MEVKEGSGVGWRRTRAYVAREVEEEEEIDEEGSKEEVSLRRQGARRPEAELEQLVKGGDDERDARIHSLEIELQMTRGTITVRNQQLIDE